MRSISMFLWMMMVQVLAAEPVGVPAINAGNAPDRRELEKVTIFTGTGWMLAVRSDSSGSITYGSSGQERAWVAAGELPYHGIRAAWESSSAEGDLRSSVAIVSDSGDVILKARYTSDKEQVRKWFELAMAKARPLDSERFRRLAAEVPVIGK